MKEARQKKERLCKECNSSIYGSAGKLLEHIEEHKLVKRALDAGIIVPKSAQVKGGILI